MCKADLHGGRPPSASRHPAWRGHGHGQPWVVVVGETADRVRQAPVEGNRIVLTQVKRRSPAAGVGFCNAGCRYPPPQVGAGPEALTSGDRADGGSSSPLAVAAAVTGKFHPPDKGSLPMPIRVVLLALFLLAVAAPSPALAIDPAYLGYWAEDTAACTTYDAFRITPEGFSS